MKVPCVMNAGAAEGLALEDLAPFSLGHQRTSALLNCLLQLKRLHVMVQNGRQAYGVTPSI